MVAGEVKVGDDSVKQLWRAFCFIRREEALAQSVLDKKIALFNL